MTSQQHKANDWHQPQAHQAIKSPSPCLVAVYAYVDSIGDLGLIRSLDWQLYRFWWIKHEIIKVLLLLRCSWVGKRIPNGKQEHVFSGEVLERTRYVGVGLARAHQTMRWWESGACIYKCWLRPRWPKAHIVSISDWQVPDALECLTHMMALLPLVSRGITRFSIKNSVEPKILMLVCSPSQPLTSALFSIDKIQKKDSL